MFATSQGRENGSSGISWPPIGSKLFSNDKRVPAGSFLWDGTGKN